MWHYCCVRHASLFSGIGGFELAAQWMGWENVLSCEYDPFCQRVLKHHFPTSTLYGDIRELDGTQYRGTIDVLTGGFPCQPFSAAGRRKGTDDNRFLWPEMLRVIREIQLTWIVAENVRGITSIDNGMVFERVCSELEENEYQVQPFCIPACAVGAPHRRERMWFLAHATSDRRERRGASIETEEGLQPRSEHNGELQRRSEGLHDDASHPNNTRLEGGEDTRGDSEDRTEPYDKHTGRRTGWNEPWLQAATSLCRVDDGLPRELYMFGGMGYPDNHERNGKSKGEKKKPTLEESVWREMQSVWSDWKAAPPSYRDGGEEFCHSLCPLPCQRTQEDWFRDVGVTEEGKTVLRLWNRICAESFQEAQHLFPELLERIGEIERKKKVGCSGLTLPRWRKESLKAYGNAIVPAVAYQIFQSIQTAELSRLSA